MGKRESYLVTSACVALIMGQSLPASAQTAPADQDGAPQQPAEAPATGRPAAGQQAS